MPTPQTLGTVFTQESKPYEVEIVVAEVGQSAEQDQIYRLTYDGSVADEQGFIAMGGAGEHISAGLQERWAPGMNLGDALGLAHRAAVSGPGRWAVTHPDRDPARGRGAGPGAAPTHLPPHCGAVARGVAEQREPHEGRACRRRPDARSSRHVDRRGSTRRENRAGSVMTIAVTGATGEARRAGRP